MRWLFTHSRVEEWAFSDSDEIALPLEAKLVCDMFWINSDQLCRDVRKRWREALGGNPYVPPMRPPHYAGWR